VLPATSRKVRSSPKIVNDFGSTSGDCHSIVIENDRCAGGDGCGIRFCSTEIGASMRVVRA